MFYRIDEDIKEIGIDEISEDFFTAGFVTPQELEEFGLDMGFSKSSIDSCQNVSPLFRTDVEVYDTYTFTEMRIVSDITDEDYIALFLRKNMMLVVNVKDTDASILRNFEASIRRFPASKVNPVKIACAFIESFISGGSSSIEKLRYEMSDMEETVVHGNADDEFNIQLLNIKKKLLMLHNYYEQILDIAEALEENENDIFEDDQLMYVSNLSNKVTRLREDVDSLDNMADHLQDAYSSALDLKLNHTMKIFTVITTIFFPLTIIVGWYGMNFTHMPELTWRYGYIYVIVFSLITILTLLIIGKKKKWF